MTDFSPLIIEWYRLNQRSLPWRETSNPYFIWISEIILQQTRVDQGMSYYFKFIKNYPTVFDLAAASEQAVLNDWQGLGYYSRARNLHATSKIIADDLEGKFPENYNEILKLKGVGPYTAAAIASFAFDEHVAVVDGNVYRVLSRFYDINEAIDSTLGKKMFQELADTLVPMNNSAEFNQAIMEFGALQCVPVNPNCVSCPINASCLAYNSGTVSIRPVKTKKTKITKRYFHYFIFENQQGIVLQKRNEKDIWQHLFQFPLHESAQPISEVEILEIISREYQLIPTIISKESKHILSHQHIFAKFYHFDDIPNQFLDQVIGKIELSEYPLPRLIDRYLSDFD